LRSPDHRLPRQHDLCHFRERELSRSRPRHLLARPDHARRAGRRGRRPRALREPHRARPHHLGGDPRQPGAAVPVAVPGALLHACGVPRHMARVRARPEQPGAHRPGTLRRAGRSAAQGLRVTEARGTTSAGDWNSFWQSARTTAAHQAGSIQDAPLEAFWSGLFAEAIPRLPGAARVLDLGCGSGAVLGHAAAAGGSGWLLVGLDPAPAGLHVLRSRHARAFGVAGDAARVPFARGSFHIVASQFGLEYAGTAAIPEAARLVAPGGLLAAVMHLRYGGLYEECAVNRDAADGFLRSRLLLRFADLYRTGAALKAGRAGRDEYVQADRRLAQAVKAAGEVLQRWGRGVADGRLFRIYS